MKTTAERADLQRPHPETRSGTANSDNEIITRATYFHGGRRLGSLTGRLGSWAKGHGPFEAHDTNGRLIGIFPDFDTAIVAITEPWRWTLYWEDSYDEEVIIGVELINDRPGFPS
jgi:hypothetical protein